MKRKAVVTKWIDSRGFGFAEDAETNETIFIHQTSIKCDPGEYRYLEVGEIILYVPAENVKGKHGLDVEKEFSNEYIPTE